MSAMNPATPALPAQAAISLSHLSVTHRLRLMLAALAGITLCGAALLYLNHEARRTQQHAYLRVDGALQATLAAQQAKDSLVALRRQLAMTVTAASGPDAGNAMQTAIAARLPQALARAGALQAVDAETARVVTTAATAVAEAALDGARELQAGNAAAGAARFRQFPQLGAPAEEALETLLARQHAEMRATMQAAEAQQAAKQRVIAGLLAVLFVLTVVSGFMVLQAIFRPLKRLHAALGEVAKGRTLDAPPVLGQDEFGQLGQALHGLSRLSAQLNHVAYRDALTGLPNRMQFEQDLAARTVNNAPFAVVLVDIDRFRTINDGYGHVFGDAVLRAVATRLQWLTEGSSRLYRYGGDLFALIVEAGGAGEPGRFRSVIGGEAERLRFRMTDAILVEQRNLALCVSLGVALHPEDGRTVDALASGADAALFQAKQAGRNVVQFARHDAALRARQRIELADELREALKTGAIQPHFQPIVDLGSGSVVCAESLARWRHPVRGFVPPDQFISIAEDSGQIDALTEQLLRSACATAAGWEPLRGHAAPKLAFNLSARQVRQGVVEMVSAVLTETGLPASRLEIEITESAIIERPETAERLLLQLKELGVSVALDDFGTGYSSLSYLMRFPIDKIKVDRSFVSQVNGQRQAGKIVAATISLAASLDITLVAEGVETLGQMVTLYELGCRQQQGWMFSKALPSEEFARWSGKAPLKLDAVIRAQAEAANDVPHAA